MKARKGRKRGETRGRKPLPPGMKKIQVAFWTTPEVVSKVGGMPMARLAAKHAIESVAAVVWMVRGD